MKPNTPHQPRHAANVEEWIWEKINDWRLRSSEDPILSEPFSEVVKLWSTMDVLTEFAAAIKKDAQIHDRHEEDVPDSGPYVPNKMSVLRDEVIPGLIAELARRIDRVSP